MQAIPSKLHTSLDSALPSCSPWHHAFNKQQHKQSDSDRYIKGKVIKRKHRERKYRDSNYKLEDDARWRRRYEMKTMRRGWNDYLGSDMRQNNPSHQAQYSRRHWNRRLGCLVQSSSMSTSSIKLETNPLNKLASRGYKQRRKYIY